MLKSAAAILCWFWASECDVAGGWDEVKQHDVLFLMGGEHAC
jgi:hypothetical protein